jgi:hypothetical protein
MILKHALTRSSQFSTSSRGLTLLRNRAYIFLSCLAFPRLPFGHYNGAGSRSSAVMGSFTLSVNTELTMVRIRADKATQLYANKAQLSRLYSIVFKISLLFYFPSLLLLPLFCLGSFPNQQRIGYEDRIWERMTRVSIVFYHWKILVLGDTKVCVMDTCCLIGLSCMR